MIFPRFLSCSILLLGTGCSPLLVAGARFQPSLLSVRGGADWYHNNHNHNDYMEEPEEEEAESSYMQQFYHQTHDSSMTHAYDGDDDDDWSFSPPHINLSDMALALRWTGEMNRQLYQVGRRTTQSKEAILESTFPNHHQQQQYDPLRGGGGGAAMVYRIKEAAPISTAVVDHSTEALTLFHAKTPRISVSKPLQGASRWGPDLQEYLVFLTQSLSLSNDNDEHVSLIWTLAMIYLDRACSVETPRSANTAVACPYCTPRTVHRLVLSALLIAVQAVKAVSLEQCYYDKNLQSLGIPLQQLQDMVDWMKAACGDPGLFVSLEQLQDWKQMWTRRFGNGLSDKGHSGTTTNTDTATLATEHERGTHRTTASAGSAFSVPPPEVSTYSKHNVRFESELLPNPSTPPPPPPTQHLISRTAIGAQ